MRSPTRPARTVPISQRDDAGHAGVCALRQDDAAGDVSGLDDEKTTVVTSYREPLEVAIAIHLFILPPTRFPSVR
jgi:hypothetical protein